MPAFDEAFASMYKAAGDKKRREAEMAEREQRMGWEREDRARINKERTDTDNAFARLRGMQTDGIVTEGAGDLSAGGIQMVRDQGYGATQGNAAVQEMAGDFARENARFATAGVGSTTPNVDTQVRGLAVNGPKSRAAKESDTYGALMDIAAARKDAGAYAGAMTAKKGAQYSEGLADGYKAFDQLQASGGLEGYLKQLSADGGVSGGFSTMDYTVGTGKDARKSKYIVYDPEGKGSPVKVDMDDARQIFAIRHTMEIDPVRAQAELRALKGDQRKLAMQMLDIQFKGAGLNNDVQNRTFSQDMEERKLAQAADADRARIGLGYAGLRQRATELDRTNPTMSAADREALMKIEAGWHAEKDPKKRADLERQYQMVASRAALGMGKVLGLPSMRQERPVITEEQVMGYAERLGADPAHKGKNIFELRQIALAQLQPGAEAADGVGSGWTSPPAATTPAAPRGGIPPKLETTRHADGRTLYRLPGQSQWSTSERDARRAEIDRIRQVGAPAPQPYGIDPGY